MGWCERALMWARTCVHAYAQAHCGVGLLRKRVHVRLCVCVC